MMAKEYKMTPKTKLAYEALQELGGSATFAELKAHLKAQGETVGTANLNSLKTNGFLTAEPVEVERTIVDKVNMYTVAPQETDADVDQEENAE